LGHAINAQLWAAHPLLIEDRPEKRAFEEDGIEIEAELGGVVIRQTLKNRHDYALTRGSMARVSRHYSPGKADGV
jgi:hypothetical protein